MKAVILSIALAAILAAPAAHARPVGEGDARSASIRSGDLNLATPGGLATLRGRVKVAANQLCGIAPALPFGEARAIGACRAQVFRSAERQAILAMAKPDSIVAGTR
jgi:UrcA family protein